MDVDSNTGFTVAVERWMDLANCRGMDTRLFFPDQGGDAPRQVEEALRVCGRCEVRSECLDYALRFGITEGIWGGLPEKSRRGARRRAQRAVAKEVA